MIMHIPTGSETIDRYLAMRRRTKWLRKYGGPLIALTFLVIAIVLITQMGQRWPKDSGTGQDRVSYHQ